MCRKNNGKQHKKECGPRMPRKDKCPHKRAHFKEIWRTIEIREKTERKRNCRAAIEAFL